MPRDYVPWDLYVLPGVRAANQAVLEAVAQGHRAHIEGRERQQYRVRILPASDTVYTSVQWAEEATRRFGADPMLWAFVCPGCGHVARARDWKAAGARATAVAHSCVGRWLEGRHDWSRYDQPCNYTLGGPIKLPTGVFVEAPGKRVPVFAFASEAAVALMEVPR